MSCVHPGMNLGSEYPRNPRIRRGGGGGGVSCGGDRSIPGIPGYSDMSCVHPGMIPGSSEYPRNPGILRQGGGVSCVHPGMIPGSSEYPRNPGILRQGGGGGRAVSIPGCDRPSISGIPGYSDRGGGEVRPSQDDPRIVRVSQESQDTQTGGGWDELCPSRDDPGIVRVSQESQDTQRGGGGGG